MRTKRLDRWVAGGLTGCPGTAYPTNPGRATPIVREYADSPEGRSQLEADEALLRTDGYELTSREHRPRTPDWKRSVSMLLGLLSFFCLHFYRDPSAAKIVATFELRRQQPPAEPAPVRGER